MGEASLQRQWSIGVARPSAGAGTQDCENMAGSNFTVLDAQGLLISEVVLNTNSFPDLYKNAKRHRQSKMVKDIKRPGEMIIKGHRSYDLMLLLQLGIRNLREMFKIDTADYMISICGSDALRELSSSAKSGSIFFSTQDNRFMIKTLQKSEAKVLCRFNDFKKFIEQCTTILKMDIFSDPVLLPYMAFMIFNMFSQGIIYVN